MRYSVDMETRCSASVEHDGDGVIRLQVNEFFEDEESAQRKPMEAPNRDGWEEAAIAWMTASEAVEVARALLEAAKEAEHHG